MYTHSRIKMIVFFILILMLSPILYSQSADIDSTIVCKNCQAIIPINAHFCPKCGTRVVQSMPISQAKNGDVQILEPEITLEDTSVTKTLQEVDGELNSFQDTLDVDEPSKDIAAKAYYEIGMAMFEKGAYFDAAITFRTVIKDFPDSKYSDAASLMVNACQKMDYLEKQITSQKESKKKSGNSSFTEGFFGGCSAIAGAILLVILLISRN